MNNIKCKKCFSNKGLFYSQDERDAVREDGTDVETGDHLGLSDGKKKQISWYNN